MSKKELDMITSIGQQIRMLRVKRSITIDDLAILSGSSRAYIWKVEKGAIANPSLKKLNAIADGLKIPVDAILKWDSKEGSADAEDLAFIDEFRRFSPEKREKIREIASILE